MNYSYRISNKALEDLEGIWLPTLENWSVKQADRYYNLIINEIEFISRNFESGKSMDHIRKGYKAAKVKSHLISIGSLLKVKSISSEYPIREWISKID